MKLCDFKVPASKRVPTNGSFTQQTEERFSKQNERACIMMGLQERFQQPIEAQIIVFLGFKYGWFSKLGS